MSDKDRARQEGGAIAQVVKENRIVEQGDDNAMNRLLEMALKDDGVSVEKLERLVGLHERMSDRAAAKEFAVAVSNFQNECPAIEKKSKARIDGRSGTKYSYNYPELDQIERTIRPHLHKNGLSYTWDGEVTEKTVTSICILRHINGHHEKSRFSMPIDSSNQRMDRGKQTTGTNTVAKRQSLIMVLGLTTCDPDTDGNIDSTDTITKEQVANLQGLVANVDKGGDTLKRLLKYLQVDNIEGIRAVDYANAVATLERMR